MLGYPTRRLADLFREGDRWSDFEHHAEVTSTNTVVADRARRGAPTGLVVVADHQTAGRGRHGRRWWDRPPGSPTRAGRPGSADGAASDDATDPAGSLLVSCLTDLRPAPATVAPVTLVPLAAGLAVVDAAARAGVETWLKWPNDVLARAGPSRAGESLSDETGKCAGVLVESVAGRQVVGIGVNLDWRAEADNRGRAGWTSLAEARPAAGGLRPPGARDIPAGERAHGRGGHPTVNRWEMLADLLVALDARLRTVEQTATGPHDRSGGRPARGLLDDYRASCLTLGRNVTVTTHGGSELVGVAVDVDPTGALMVRTDHEVVRVTAGDVTHLRRP